MAEKAKPATKLATYSDLGRFAHVPGRTGTEAEAMARRLDANARLALPRLSPDPGRFPALPLRELDPGPSLDSGRCELFEF